MVTFIVTSCYDKLFAGLLLCRHALVLRKEQQNLPLEIISEQSVNHKE
jgi:hypothetical protein